MGKMLCCQVLKHCCTNYGLCCCLSECCKSSNTECENGLCGLVHDPIGTYDPIGTCMIIPFVILLSGCAIVATYTSFLDYWALRFWTLLAACVIIQIFFVVFYKMICCRWLNDSWTSNCYNRFIAYHLLLYGGMFAAYLSTVSVGLITWKINPSICDNMWCGTIVGWGLLNMLMGFSGVGIISLIFWCFYRSCKESMEKVDGENNARRSEGRVTVAVEGKVEEGAPSVIEDKEEFDMSMKDTEECKVYTQAVEGKIIEGVPPRNINDDRIKKCSICHVELPSNDMRFLPCMHSFHHICIYEWLKVKSDCPICRIEVR